MTIIGRADLERSACECYGIVKAEFDAIVNHDDRH